jgi:hypothetical protein
MPADLWTIIEVEKNINGTVQKPPKVLKHLVSYRDTLSDDDLELLIYTPNCDRFS